MTTTAIQAQHARNLLRLARVNAALSARDEYEAKQRGGLKELQLTLVERIGELEALFARG